MKKLLYLLLFPTCELLAQAAAAPAPQVFNTAGTTAKVGGNYYGFNIGEPVAVTGQTGSNYFTQGFLQPDYRIGTAFSASIYTGSESCKGSGDGYVVTNPFNNKGPVTIVVNGTTTYTTTTIMNLLPGNYSIVISDSTGQSITQNVVIQASTAECADTVYHAFSPNGDGLNDLFIISGIERFADNHVYFFNRWGQLIWDAEKYDNVKVVWDGKDKNGALLSSGTYFYLIDKKGYRTQKSWVQITR